MTETKSLKTLKQLSKDLKSKQRKQKKLSEEKFFQTFDWNKTLAICFDTTSNDFKRMFDIIDYARSQNRGIKADSKYYNVHHIIPRSYFKKNKYPIDNREINLVKLTLQEHFMVHYYAWKCSTSIKRQMATAFHLMVGRATVGLNNAPLKSIEELSELMIPLEKKKDKSLIEQEKIKKLIQLYGDNDYSFTDENHIKFKCSNCGKISIKRYDSSVNLKQCKFCNCSQARKGVFLSDRTYPKEGVILCVCVSQEDGAFWKLLSYKVTQPMATLNDILDYVTQNNELCDRVFFVKVYTDKTKEELTDYFNNKFGYERSYTYYIRVYLKQKLYIDNKQNIYIKSKYSEQEWNKIKSYYFYNKQTWDCIPEHMIHFIYSHVCKDKHFMERLNDIINRMGKLNNWKDVKDFK